MNSEDVPKAQILWQCRRGMLELDMLLLSFCNAQYDSLDQIQKTAFIQLLKCTDQELFDWLLGKSNPENLMLLSIVQLIRERKWEAILSSF